ncbi:TonB-dependent receptor [Sphingomonas yunnanensis]|uniref:TonB-dependent receptor n=1 Tax=Sphingomonas yunnanensis TaxID=310400 RepID=UPI001CA783D9|nr:TonB-dependent receptor [Sphingomonas yunnanensis]MBY9062679.1 TonB-dependent receptor [Sphingomonas yunnanensis]
MTIFYRDEAFLLSIVGALLCAPAAAQTQPPAGAVAGEAADATAAPALGDVIVTAQRRRTDLQETPVAVSVLDSTGLRDRHVQSLGDLRDGAIPSLRVAPFYSRNSALIVNIRGVGVLGDSNQPARDQGVGVYVDGVYLGRAQGLGAALYDVASLEVLKGPQGTLFGRNTEGGAVNIVTRAPSGQLGLRAAAGVGSAGAYGGEVHFDLPSLAGVAVKLDGIVTARGGLVRDPLTGQTPFDFYERRGAHLAALWHPAEGVSADYAFDTAHDGSSPLYYQTVAAGSLPRAPAQPVEQRRVRVASVGVPQQDSVGRTHGHRLTLGWQAAPGLELKSISALRIMAQSQYDNGSANNSAFHPGGAFARYSLADFDQRQWSQEVQLIGEAPRLHYLAGALYYRERVADRAQAFNTMRWNTAGTAASVIPLTLAAQPIDRASRITTDSLGAFGQATWSPAVEDDWLHLTGGLRWSRDSKRGNLYLVNNKTPSVNGVVAPRGLDARWSRVDPMVTIAADAGTDLHAYARWSTGYRSGGANSRSLTYAPFAPESVSVWELGTKSEWLDRRARLNLAVYAGGYAAIQIDFTANYLQRDQGGRLLESTRTTTETFNAPGRGRLRGAEAELAVLPAEGLTLSGAYARTDLRIPPTANPFPQTNGTVVTAPVRIYPVYTPRDAISGAIDYHAAVPGGTLRAHVDASADSGFYANYNDPERGMRQPRGAAGVVVNGRVALTDVAVSPGATIELALWSRNLLDEQHLFFRQYTTLLGTAGFFNERRTLGLELGLRF